MLLTREEMTFDFGGKKLDPVRDKDVLAWATHQFLYGEVTGIQIGHWLYRAPDLDAARFLSRQAVEEFQHVGNFLRILSILGAKPEPAHASVRFLATGAMPETWEEHVAMEMAIGEGLVLQAFYALIDTVDHEEIVTILKRGVRQEERHVDFGERRTMRAIEGKPWLRRRLLGKALVTVFAVGRLEAHMKKRLPMDHPVLQHLPAFVKFSVSRVELRMLRMGLLDRPLAEIPTRERLALVAEAYAGQAAESAARKVFLSPLQKLGLFREKKLTDTYLDDPLVRDGLIGAQTEAEAPLGRSEGGRSEGGRSEVAETARA
jgi:hypothetical protein